MGDVSHPETSIHAGIRIDGFPIDSRLMHGLPGAGKGAAASPGVLQRDASAAVT